MEAFDPLGQVEFTVIDAVHRGVLRAWRIPSQTPGLRHDPAGYALTPEALHRCERSGLLRSERDSSGRRYELTPAGRARLRGERRFRAALAAMLLRS